MNMKEKTIIEILKRPTEYTLDLVSRAMSEVLELTAGYDSARLEPVPVRISGGKANGQ